VPREHLLSTHLAEIKKLASPKSNPIGRAVIRGIGAFFARNGITSGFADLVCVDNELSTSIFRKRHPESRQCRFETRLHPFSSFSGKRPPEV
jgi:hypothetical protein